MKKKILGLTLAAILVLVTILPAAAMAASFSSSNAAFKAGGTTFKLGSTSTAWKSKIGSYRRTALDGCTVGVKAYTYKFSSAGVTVETVQKTAKSKEAIYSVVITKNKIATSRGLKVGHSVTKMISLYGEKYKKNGTTYTYSSGGKKMVVKTSKNKITRIALL